MANIQGNRVALEDTLDGRLPKTDVHLVQDPLEGNDFYVKQFPVGTVGWQRIDCKGYELVVLAGDDMRELDGSVAYVRFGPGGPGGTTSASGIEGALTAIPGSRFPVPQSFSGVWFLPGVSASWRIVVVKRPHVHVHYGPYGARMGTPKGVLIGRASMANETVAANTQKSLFTSADIAAQGAIGLPITFRAHIYGGGPTLLGGSDFPMELVIVEHQSASASKVTRVWPFPGSGQADIEYPLNVTQQWADAPTNSIPTVEIYVQNASASVDNTGSGDFALRIGDGNELPYEKYTCAVAATKIGTGLAASFCHPAGPLAQVEAFVRNADNSQALSWYYYQLTPKVLGGVWLSDAQNVVIALSTLDKRLLTRVPGYLLHTFNFTGLPTGNGTAVIAINPI